MDAFLSRFKYFLHVTDPRNILLSNEEIRKAKEIISEHHKKNTKESTFSGQQLARYQQIVDASIHPVTGEIIPALFRVSAIAPVNIPIVFAMLTCPPSNIAGTLFLHWFNQSYNTACNYANRSGSSQELNQLATAYGLAVTSACSLAFGLGKLYERAPNSIKRYGIIIPCIATAAANVSNIAFTRMSEITTGTTIADENGIKIGISHIAGYECVKQTAITRCILVPFACFLLPPIAMNILSKIKLVPNSKQGKLLLELCIIYASLQAALPAALAVYPQKATFAPVRLESQFHHVIGSNGHVIRVYYANKGL